jgi:hypothetical protein
VVSRRSPKALWFSTKGERSGGPKEYGNQVNDGFCSPIFLVWVDTEFDIFLIGAKRRYRHSNGLQWPLFWDERSPMGALVCPSHELCFSSGVRGGNLYGRFRCGEMFLNFMLEENCACLAGLDLTHYVPKGELAGDGRRHLV